MSQNDHEDVKDLAAQYKERLADQARTEKVFLEEREILKTHGAKSWERLSELINEKREAFNKEIGSEVLTWEKPDAHHWLLCRKHDHARLEGTYVSPLYLVTFKCPEARIDLELHQSVQDGRVEFVALNRKTKVEHVNKPDDIASGLFQDFLAK